MRSLPLFPISGAILFPELHLPLHVFEPRFRAMIDDAMKSDKLIGIIQPCDADESAKLREARAQMGQKAALFGIGCMGRIVECDELGDGGCNIVLEGEARFTLRRELSTTTPYRQGEIEVIAEDRGAYLSSVERGGLENEARRFADVQGYSVDWDSLSRLDDRSLVNGVSQIAPFDAASKQALLEAEGLSERCELLIQLMQFYGHHDTSEDEQRVTLQ